MSSTLPKLPKLVRDKITEKIIDSGNTPTWHTATSLDEHTQLLHDKINEEFQEFLDDPCLEEAGDCYEVLRALFELYGLQMSDVSAEADLKAAKCGGFYEGIVLESVEEPQ